ncbi:MAG: lactate utilization protein [Eubacteriales bacterium]|nr:lactate utilization protein [Eubacteriales bacterium]
MDALCQQVVEGMRTNGFEVIELHTAKEACDYLCAQIADETTVGVGGSVSVRDTGVLDALAKKNCTVYSHWGAKREDSAVICAKAMNAQVYLCSANAVTRSGKLVLVDGTGNRVGAVCYGPAQVYFIISHSKVVDGGINTAVARIKKMACPLNARRLGLNTPCARTGNCGADCAESMCRLTLAVDRVPRNRKMTVLFVEETLGY